MMNIAICDDEIIYQNIIKSKVDDVFTREKKSMPEESGLIVADVIADKLPRTNVVFITNRDDLVYEALKCTPFSFIRKSCLEDLSKPLAKLIEKVLRIRMSCLDYITIRILTKLTPMEICCMMLWKEKEYALKMDK